MNSKPRLEAEIARVNTIRAQLLSEDNDIDERTLADTIEGETSLNELLIEIIRGALEDKSNAEKIDGQIAEREIRRDRFKTRADRRRRIVADAMQEASLATLRAPEFSASLRNNPPHVVVIDEELIPEEFFEYRPHLRKRELGEAMKGGAQVAGAALSNPGVSLSVRTK